MPLKAETCWRKSRPHNSLEFQRLVYRLYDSSGDVGCQVSARGRRRSDRGFPNFARDVSSLSRKLRGLASSQRPEFVTRTPSSRQAVPHRSHCDTVPALLLLVSLLREPNTFSPPNVALRSASRDLHDKDCSYGPSSALHLYLPDSLTRHSRQRKRHEMTGQI